MHMQGSDNGPSYAKYSSALHDLAKLKEQHIHKNGLQLLEQLLIHAVSTVVESEADPFYRDLVSEIQRTKSKLQQIVCIKKLAWVL